MLRILLLIIGYFIGNIETGYIFGKLNKMDIRNYGSGNAGATNTLRVLGPKAGLIVFFGDFCKHKTTYAFLLSKIFGEQD